MVARVKVPVAEVLTTSACDLPNKKAEDADVYAIYDKHPGGVLGRRAASTTGFCRKCSPPAYGS